MNFKPHFGSVVQQAVIAGKATRTRLPGLRWSAGHSQAPQIDPAGSPPQREDPDSWSPLAARSCHRSITAVWGRRESGSRNKMGSTPSLLEEVVGVMASRRDVHQHGRTERTETETVPA